MFKNQFIEQMVEKLYKEGYSSGDYFIEGTDVREVLRIVVDGLGEVMGEAKKSGNEERIKEAQEKHDIYRDICLKSDRMELGVTIGDL